MIATPPPVVLALRKENQENSEEGSAPKKMKIDSGPQEQGTWYFFVSHDACESYEYFVSEA